MTQQTDIGSYACKGRTKFEGRDVLSYRLETEPEKGSTADPTRLIACSTSTP